MLAAFMTMHLADGRTVLTCKPLQRDGVVGAEKQHIKQAMQVQIPLLPPSYAPYMEDKSHHNINTQHCHQAPP
jgi:hypothetical protein